MADTAASERMPRGIADHAAGHPDLHHRYHAWTKGHGIREVDFWWLPMVPARSRKEVVGISLPDFPWRIASHTLRFDNRTLIVLQCPGACDLEAQIRRQMRQRPTALRQQVPEASLIGWEFLTEECGLRNDQFQQFQELIENHSHP